jgi:hypothetical protein
MRTDPPIKRINQTRPHMPRAQKSRDSNNVYCLQFHSATGSRAAFPDDDPEWRDWALPRKASYNRRVASREPVDCIEVSIDRH